MKYLKKFNKEILFFNKIKKYKIDEICKKYNIKNYNINTDGSIDVDNVVYLGYRKLTKMPLKFNKINGYFACCNNELISLEGSPVEVNGVFDCSYNNLTSLEGSPIELNDFDCHENKLVSFEYSPKVIKGFFDCRSNNIKTFEYFPRYLGGVFYCKNNPICEIWNLFLDISKIELLNDFDIFRDEDTDEPKIFIDRLNDFLEMIGYSTVEKVDGYKNI